jgi:hypothetical protein
MLSKKVSWETFINLQRRKRPTVRPLAAYRKLSFATIVQLATKKNKSPDPIEFYGTFIKQLFSIFELFCMRSTLKSLQKVPILKIFISNNFDEYKNAQKSYRAKNFCTQKSKVKKYIIPTLSCKYLFII